MGGNGSISCYIPFPLAEGFAGLDQGHQVRHGPKVIRNTSGHRRRRVQALVNPDEVVPEHVQADRVAVVFNFLENPFVNRVKRRMLIRIVKFSRSTKLVAMCCWSGSPEIMFTFTPESFACE